MDIILSTRNPSKAEQIQAVFAGSPIKVCTLDEMNIVGEAVEDGTTLEENALKKAHFARERSGGKYWTMADDTGIFITALNGEPGIRSARWAGNVPTEETMWYCLERMTDVEDRSAVFRTVVAVVSPSGSEKLFYGEVTGHILEEPRVPPQSKMPYSALHVPEGQELSWAEMTIEQENEISHRGKAFRLARAHLQSIE